LKQDLTTTRKQNTNLDSELHSNEKTVNHLRTRIAVLEQEVKDKDELVQRTQDLLNNEQSLKKQQEEVSNDRGLEVKKLHASIKHVSAELMKGNEIINKLQAKLRACNNKMKLKNEILNQQEKVVLEKEKEFGEIKSELKIFQENSKNLTDENKELKNSLNKKTQELEEAAKLLKKDENSKFYL
jgi:spindle assembly abnormal protein 6